MKINYFVLTCLLLAATALTAQEPPAPPEASGGDPLDSEAAEAYGEELALLDPGEPDESWDAMVAAIADEFSVARLIAEIVVGLGATIVLGRQAGAMKKLKESRHDRELRDVMSLDRGVMVLSGMTVEEHNALRAHTAGVPDTGPRAVLTLLAKLALKLEFQERALSDAKHRPVPGTAMLKHHAMEARKASEKASATAERSLTAVDSLQARVDEMASRSGTVGDGIDAGDLRGVTDYHFGENDDGPLWARINALELRVAGRVPSGGKLDTNRIMVLESQYSQIAKSLLEDANRVTEFGTELGSRITALEQADPAAAHSEIANLHQAFGEMKTKLVGVSGRLEEQGEALAKHSSERGKDRERLNVLEGRIDATTALARGATAPLPPVIGTAWGDPVRYGSAYANESFPG